jgi:hypothetical protein
MLMFEKKVEVGSQGIILDQYGPKINYLHLILPEIKYIDGRAGERSYRTSLLCVNINLVPQ